MLIIGAGVIGCAVARELSRRGAGVRLFDARRMAGGATQASAGVLAPYIEAHERGPLFDLTVRSLGLYDSFMSSVREDSGIEVEYMRCGTLEVAADDAGRQRLQRSAQAAPGEVEWLDSAAARALEPALPGFIAGAALVPSHGYVAVSRLTEALAWAALRHGAEIEAQRRIVAVDRDGDRLTVRDERGDSWSGDRIVVAAGSWAGQIGLRDAAAGRVRPVRGQLLELHWHGRPLDHVIWGEDCYVVPWRDGTMLVGATVEEVGFDERTTAAGVRDLLGAACELLPEAWRATFRGARAGLRPATSDGLPIIGPSPETPGVIYATGHYRNGILLAPLTAALVADLIVDGRSDPMLTRVDPGRFAAGRH